MSADNPLCSIVGGIVSCTRCRGWRWYYICCGHCGKSLGGLCQTSDQRFVLDINLAVRKKIRPSLKTVCLLLTDLVKKYPTRIFLTFYAWSVFFCFFHASLIEKLIPYLLMCISIIYSGGGGEGKQTFFFSFLNWPCIFYILSIHEIESLRELP